MRKLHEMTIDRALLVYVLHLAEPHGINGDVKLQQLLFLCELQLFAKGLKGLHFEFFRYAYGAFSKDLDNDLLALRRRERIENFSLTDKAGEVLKILPDAVEGVEVNEKVIEILQAVTATYAPQDSSAIVQSVEAVEISSPDQPEFKLAMRDISFHSTLLVPSRIDVQSEFTLAPKMQARLNAALGY
ncbi:MAG: hypothetical protein HY205_01200 [Nitrospirae bacterium]|nr:hypothetical protein [Nitrospirota bacterium]